MDVINGRECEITYSLLEHCTYPAIMTDYDFFIRAKNSRAKYSLGMLRLNSKLSKRISQGDLVTLRELPVGEVYNLNIDSENFYGALVYKYNNGYVFRIMTLNAVLLRRIIEVSPSEGNIIKHTLNIRENNHLKLKTIEAVKTHLRKNEREISAFNKIAGQLSCVLCGGSVLSSSVYNISSLMNQLREALVKKHVLKSIKIDFINYYDDIYTKTNALVFESVMVSIISTALRYLSGKIISVKCSYVGETYLICVDYDSIFDVATVNRICGNDFEDYLYNNEYADIFFAFTLIKRLSELYNMDFIVSTFGGSRLQMRLEGKIYDVKQDDSGIREPSDDSISAHLEAIIDQHYVNHSEA